MLVAVSQDVRHKFQEIETLRLMRENAGAVTATFNELKKMQKVAQQIDTLLSLLHRRLPEQDMQGFIYATDTLLRALRASQQAFGQTPNQEKALSNLSEKMQSLVKEIRNSWRIYAEQQTQQSFELLKLVKYLPEVQNEQAQLTELQNHLTAFFERVPTTPANLTEFDQSLQALKHHLSNVSGLSESVRQFLQKTLSGQATLADMTDEVLDWCRQGKRGSAFTIRFVQ
jgi:DNA repair ATPase RecN